jgi:hypothetical protein
MGMEALRIKRRRKQVKRESKPPNYLRFYFSSLHYNLQYGRTQKKKFWSVSNDLNHVSQIYYHEFIIFVFCYDLLDESIRVVLNNVSL